MKALAIKGTKEAQSNQVNRVAAFLLGQGIAGFDRSVPTLNTSSLPDLIFTVLFFFMVVTHMRQVTLKVRFRVPQGTELTRLTKKSAVSYVYIGRPSEAVPGIVPS